MCSLIWIFSAVIGGLYILCKSSSTARYYVKFTFFILICFVSTTVFIPFMLVNPGDWKNGLMPGKVFRMFSKLMGITFQVRGNENIVKNSGCVVLINHQSCLDLIVLAELWPIMDKCTVICRKEIFYLGTFGLATWLWGSIYIDRLNPENAQTNINKTGATIRDRQARVLMFPEGTRHTGLDLLPFKKGAFYLAIASKCPIQPIVVSNYYFLDNKTRRFDGGENIIRILPPISTDGVTKETLPNLIEETYKKMSKAYKELSQEVLTRNKVNNYTKVK